MQLKRIEPSTSREEAGALPLSYNRDIPFETRNTPPQSSARQPGLGEPGHEAFRQEACSKRWIEAEIKPAGSATGILMRMSAAAA